MCHLSHEMAAESNKMDPTHDQEGEDAGLAVGSGSQGGNQLSLPATVTLEATYRVGSIIKTVELSLSLINLV